ncbi:Hypothetical protein GbCGDNIH4_1629 [Granulibacter bethesdensis CGDNIH4]|nr:Hypothetical protein GbCGDNIH4_1629 [Granulibacter bethesdensis CGDNIH4]
MHAEEPSSSAPVTAGIPVYLRARGGTTSERYDCDTPIGLSPRTRRNQRSSASISSGPGSISAHAEEPKRLGGAALSNTVYLRARGGTRQVR